MKRDPHLLASNAPLKEGADYTSICGRDIRKAAFVFFWDGDFPTLFETIRYGMGLCPKCSKRGIAERYIYGAVDGELMQQRGDSE